MSGSSADRTVTVVDHPLIQHKLSRLRQVDTPTKLFKELVDEIALLMVYEVTRDLPLEEIPVETPLEQTRGMRVRGKKPVVVPILRAGLGMVDAVTALMPGTRVGHVGLYRDEETLEPVEYYCKVPADPEGRIFIVVDPMLATGGSAVAAVHSLKKRGARDIRFVCLVAAPEGAEVMARTHPDVPVFAAALDRQLNERGYILPGLGDAGDRLFGTR